MNRVSMTLLAFAAAVVLAALPAQANDEETQRQLAEMNEAMKDLQMKVQAQEEQLDALRSGGVDDFVLACEADYRGRAGLEARPYPQGRRLVAALEAALGIQARDLDTQGLSGPALGEALRQARIDRGEEVIVGVNKYQREDEPEVEILDIDNTAVRESQIARLAQVRAERDAQQHRAALQALRQAAESESANLLACCVDAARARATVGEATAGVNEFLAGPFSAFRDALRESGLDLLPDVTPLETGGEK